MRLLLLLIATTFTAQLALSQGCDELFISEYIEGWSNNKAIEVYNPTANVIDLSGYSLERYSNGSQDAADNQKIDLGGMIEPWSTFVVVLDKRDPDGIDFETPVWEELQAVADTFLCPVYDDNNTMYFNGNDAIVFRKNDGNEVIDVFGKIGEDPGNPSDGGGWNDVEPDFAWNLNGATSWTYNHTLVRKNSVMTGDTNPVDGFNVGLEYDSLPANTFTELGWHESVCNVDYIQNLKIAQLAVFPNPSTDGFVQIECDESIVEVEVFSAVGNRSVYQLEALHGRTQRLDLKFLAAGTYVIQAKLENDSYAVSTLLIQ